MFGFVTVDFHTLDQEQKARYGRVYCGICRQLRLRCNRLSRWVLQYDMAFLALLLMSLYEPEEETGRRACGLHPISPRPWVDNRYIRYCADLNLALAYHKFRDDAADEGSKRARFLANRLEKGVQAVAMRLPRQCEAIARCIRQLSALERENCPNPDLPAGCFGRLMAELMVYEEDLWSPTLRGLGDALGRFIYLMDGAVDYRKDAKKGSYNPFLAAQTGFDRTRWETYLTLFMGRCTEHFERLPLVQDKALLDNILYRGVWQQFYQKKEGQNGRSL